MEGFNQYLHNIYNDFKMSQNNINTEIFPTDSFDTNYEPYIPRFSDIDDFNEVPLSPDCVRPYPDYLPSPSQIELDSHYNSEKRRCIDKHYLGLLDTFALISFCSVLLTKLKHTFGEDKLYVYPFVVGTDTNYLVLESYAIVSSLPSVDNVFFIPPTNKISYYGKRHGRGANHLFFFDVSLLVPSYGSFTYSYQEYLDSISYDGEKYSYLADTLIHPLFLNGSIEHDLPLTIVTRDRNSSFSTTTNSKDYSSTPDLSNFIIVSPGVYLLFRFDKLIFGKTHEKVDLDDNFYQLVTRTHIENVQFTLFLYTIPSAVVPDIDISDFTANSLPPLNKKCCIAECFGITE